MHAWAEMDPAEVAQLDLREGDWAPKAREWRAMHSQIGRAIKWTTKPVAGEMSNGQHYHHRLQNEDDNDIKGKWNNWGLAVQTNRNG